MADKKLSEEVLNHAVHSEIQARDFYKQIGDRVQNKKGRKRLVKLSQEEDGHRALLERRYKSLYGKDFVFDPNVKVGPRFDFVKTSLFSQSEALDVVSVGISAETEAIRYYSEQLETAEDAEDQKMLKDLVKFEKRHKKKLQSEFDRLTKKYYWV